MNEKTILQIVQTLPWILILSVFGGLAGFIMRLNQSTEPKPLGRIFLGLMGELFLSGFAGFLTFVLCREWGLSLNYTMVAVAISGHMGGQAIHQIARIYHGIINNKGAK